MEKLVTFTDDYGNTHELLVHYADGHMLDSDWQKVQEIMHPLRDRKRTVYKNKPAVLAAAVLRQWKLDGSPKSSEFVADIWRSIYNYAEKLKN